MAPEQKKNFTYQSYNGTLSSELCSTEQCPDEAVDLLLLGVVFVIISRNFRLLLRKKNKKQKTLEMIK